MKEETLKRLLSLIERTGDRLIVTDPAGEHPYVMMGLAHYEKLIGGEWKPEVIKHDPAPPQGLPLSLIPPDNKPPKREIPLWKTGPAATPPKPVPPPAPQPAAQRPILAEKPQNTPSSAAPAPLQEPKPLPAEDLESAEGEEQFYLEPLE